MKKERKSKDNGGSSVVKGLKKVGGVIKEGAKRAKAGAEFVRDVTNPVNHAKMAYGVATGKGLTYPGSNYIGPGNPMNRKTLSKEDESAKQHDVDYANYLKKGHSKKRIYLGYSDADERLLKKTKANTAQGIAINLGMGAKKLGHKLGLTGPMLKDSDKAQK